MSRTVCVSKDMVRAARVDELPSGPFKKFDEFCALHGVYSTHGSEILVPLAGLEPATFGLQNRCSTN